jgi:hypothetical protein
MKARSSLMLVALTVLFVPVAGAQDPGLEGKWGFAFQGGIVTEVSGNVFSDTRGTLFARDVHVFSRSFRQTYETGFNNFHGALLLNFGLAPNGEIFARGTHYKMNSPGFLAGSVEGSDLFATLEPYEEWGVELGYRYYLAWRTRLKSFVAPAVGLRFTDRILVDSMFAPDRNSAIFNLPLYNASTVFVIGADIGFHFDLGDTFYVGLEAQLRYQSKMAAAQTAPGLEGINDAGSRWSAPVLLTAGLRF